MVSHARPLKGSADTILYYTLCIIQLLYFFDYYFYFYFSIFIFAFCFYYHSLLKTLRGHRPPLEFLQTMLPRFGVDADI